MIFVQVGQLLTCQRRIGTEQRGCTTCHTDIQSRITDNSGRNRSPPTVIPGTKSRCPVIRIGKHYISRTNHIIIELLLPGIFIHGGKMLQNTCCSTTLALAVPEAPGMFLRRTGTDDTTR